MNKLFATLVAVIIAFTASSAFAVECRPVYASMPDSCPGTTVSTKFFDVAPQNFTAPRSVNSIPGDPTLDMLDSGFPPAGPSRRFHKEYNQTQLVCNLVFDIYGPSKGQPAFAGTMTTAIAVNGIPQIIVASEVPPSSTTHAFTNRLFKTFAAGDYDITVMVRLNSGVMGAQATWAAKLMQMDCAEEWNNFQKNDMTTLMDKYNP